MAATVNKVVEKPWGKETWLSLTDDYCFKRIEINAGHKTSLQYHVKKEETNYLLHGKARFHFQQPDGKMDSQEIDAGFFVHLVPGAVHAFEAVTDIVLMEASNRYVEDVVRLSDDYGRQDDGKAIHTNQRSA